MEESSTRSYPMNGIRICIDQFGEDMEGRIYSKMSTVPLYFENSCEILLRADRLFDNCGYPQSFQVKRNFMEAGDTGRFSKPTIYMEDSEIRMQHGRYLTVDILVKTRRRAGWQGILLDMDGTKLSEFRSEMELLRQISQFGKKVVRA
jgi:hypothetical protein